MRPPEAADYVPEPRLRIRYTNKHAPYNSGEERTVNASAARRLCILQVAEPAPKRHKDDHLGGWSLSGDEYARAQELDRAKKESAGDFVKEHEEQERLRKDEEARVEAAAAEEQKKDDKPEPKKFLKGKGKGKQ